MPEKPHLLPCPFCGGDAWKPVDGSVECHRCSAYGPDARKHPKMVRLWNTRHATDELLQALERLVKRCDAEKIMLHREWREVSEARSTIDMAKGKPHANY